MIRSRKIVRWMVVSAISSWAAVLYAAAPDGGLLEGLHWQAPLDRASAWSPQPGWLSNASTTATVRALSSGLAFQVPEARRGMKWSRRIATVWLPENPILVVRYRAVNMVTNRDDYAVYLDDRGPRELRAVRLNQLVSDGQWRYAAVDIRTLTTALTITALAIQVQAVRPNALFDIAELRFAEEPPPGCRLLGDKGKLVAVPPRRDAVVPLVRLAWKHRPSWLDNPASGAVDIPASANPRFTVVTAGRGMKWHALLKDPIPLAAYRYLTVRYRADGLSAGHDYSICALGNRQSGGEGYTALTALNELVADGRPHVLVVDIATAAKRIPKAKALAVQVQAADPKAMIELAELRFSQQRPKLALNDLVSIASGAAFIPGVLDPVSIPAIALFDLQPVLAHLGIADWLSGQTPAIAGIPFRLGKAPPRARGIALQTTDGRIALPLSGRGSEVYLFVLAVLTGAEAPVYGGGRLEALADRDRFLARVRYAHGPPVEALPLNVESGKCELRKGPQVLCIPTNPDRDLAGIDLVLRSPHAALALCAATVRRSGPRRWTNPVARLSMPPVRRQPRRQPVRVTMTADSVRLSCATFSAELALTPVPRLVRFEDRVSGTDLAVGNTAPPLAELFWDDGKHAASGLVPKGPPERVDGGVRLTCEDPGAPELRVLLTIRCVLGDAVRPNRLVFAAVERRVGKNGSGLPGLRFPQVGPFRLARNPEDVWVVFPSRDAVVSNRDHGLSGYYSGLFPLQFMAAAAPTVNQGVCLLTEDLIGIERRYGLQKVDGTVRFDIEYPPLPASRDRRETALAWIAPTGGDWHTGFNFYRKWLKTWYKPAAPRRQWFREVFNFRQRFLHSLDPLYDSRTGTIDLPRAIEEARAFGGIEYLHLFDWGNCGKYGRIYGRTGDYSPYDYLKGGRSALSTAIDRLQKRGTPVGLYIEGYLLQEKGKLGQAHGGDWQMRGQNGERRYWPASTEMFTCPGVRDWRKVQASTYARKVRELGVSGMYMDEFGFCGPGKKCWATGHGHPVPSFPVRTERQCTREIRKAIDSVKTGVALYSEETPCDVNSQYQDGSFSYSVRQSFLHRNLVPINLTRFAIPSFKVFQILVCDKPTATFASGVAAVFFNGDGIWLEGPAATWFDPRTLATIRRCHRILREHRRAFTCDTPEPLIATLTPGVFANRFDGPNETVFTLFNSGNVGVSGPVLRLPRVEAASVMDAWESHPVTPVIKGNWAVIPASIAPRSVGCLICRPGSRQRD